MKGLILTFGTGESCSGSPPARATSTSRACRRVSMALTPGHIPTATNHPMSHSPGTPTADAQDDLPEVNERLNLRLWLPPVLGRRLCALVWEAGQLQLLPGQVEVSARDLRAALALCPWPAREDACRGEATHVDLVRLDLIVGCHRRGLFGFNHDANTLLYTLSTWRAGLGTRIRGNEQVNKMQAVSQSERELL